MTGKTTSFSLAIRANIVTASENGCLLHVGAADGSDGYSIGVGNTTFDDAGNNLIFEACPNQWTVLGTIGTGWHHLAVVVDGAGAITGYVDGVSLTASYETEVTAWIAAVGSGNISTAHKTLVNDLVVGLKADGLWTKIDRLWLFAAENEATALVDVKTSTTATAVNAPTLSPNVGYTTTATGTKYIDTLFNASAGGCVYVQDSSHVAVYVNTTYTWAAMGCYVPNTGVEIGYYAGQWHNVGPQEDTTGTIAIDGASTGFAIWTRTASDAREFYVGGTSVFSDGAVSETTPANQTVFVGATSYLGGPIHMGDGVAAVASIGSGLNGTEAANYTSRIATYMAGL